MTEIGIPDQSKLPQNHNQKIHKEAHFDKVASHLNGMWNSRNLMKDLCVGECTLLSDVNSRPVCPNTCRSVTDFRSLTTYTTQLVNGLEKEIEKDHKTLGL